jgi:pimeloyl-ACP methyl ester carboxylesterase
MKKVAIFLTLFIASLIGLMAAFPEDATRAAFAIERFRSGLEHKSIVMDGETWHYLDGGPTEAPVVLLLHGFSADKDNWTRFSKKLTDQYRVIAPDLPGFGESARHFERDYSVSAQSDWLHDFAAALKLDRFHLGGNSMGGFIAAFYAYRYSSQVESLVLINNAGITSPNASEMQLALERGENPLLTSSAEDFDRLLGFVSYKQPFVPWPAKGVLARQSFEDSAFNRRIFDSYKNARAFGLEPILADIKQPVLIIWGEFDRVLDVSSIDVMRPLLPQAKVVIMQDTGHIPMLERPQETAAHYLEFLGSL